MMLLLWVAVAIVLLWSAKAFSSPGGRPGGSVWRPAGGYVALAFAAFLLVRGEIGEAIPFGLIGLWLLGRLQWLWPDVLDRGKAQARRGKQHEGAAGSARRAAAGGTMSEEEACQILGVRAGADAQEISRAHRSLIKKLHPDQGGTTYLAARVNQAKDVLLRR